MSWLPEDGFENELWIISLVLLLFLVGLKEKTHEKIRRNSSCGILLLVSIIFETAAFNFD